MTIYVCDLCNAEFLDGGYIYCPNCGAYTTSSGILMTKEVSDDHELYEGDDE